MINKFSKEYESHNACWDSACDSMRQNAGVPFRTRLGIAVCWQLRMVMRKKRTQQS